MQIFPSGFGHITFIFISKTMEDDFVQINQLRNNTYVYSVSDNRENHIKYTIDTRMGDTIVPRKVWNYASNCIGVVLCHTVYCDPNSY